MTWYLESDTVENFVFVNGVFTKQECEKIIDYGTSLPALTATVDNEALIDNNIRKNKVSWITPDKDNNWLYQRLDEAIHFLNNKYFKFDISSIENLQFTIYTEKDDFYDWHIDKTLQGVVRKLSLVIQLSDPKDYEGSELLIHCGQEIVGQKEQGTLMMFPSYTLHKVTPLLSGKRYSLVVWVIGKNFT